jgi:hypothetical protein
VTAKLNVKKVYIYIFHWTTKFNFFTTQRKISIRNRPFNAEFKYVSSFSPSPTGFFVTAKLNVKKVKNVYIYIYITGQKNLTFFGTRGKIFASNRTSNTEFKYVSSLSSSPTVSL